jgi:hypothetical protein
MARLRTGQRLTALDTVEDAAVAELTPPQQDGVKHMAQKWVIDEPAAAASRIRELAQRFGVDEVMVSPAASARATDDPRSAPGRMRTLELLAAQLLDA